MNLHAAFRYIFLLLFFPLAVGCEDYADNSSASLNQEIIPENTHENSPDPESQGKEEAPEESLAPEFSFQSGDFEFSIGSLNQQGEVREGNRVLIRAHAASAADYDRVVEFMITGGTATPEVDYILDNLTVELHTPITFILPAGKTLSFVRLRALDDFLVEGDETIEIKLLRFDDVYFSEVDLEAKIIDDTIPFEQDEVDFSGRYRGDRASDGISSSAWIEHEVGAQTLDINLTAECSLSAVDVTLFEKRASSVAEATPGVARFGARLYANNTSTRICTPSSVWAEGTFDQNTGEMAVRLWKSKDASISLNLEREQE